jgi:hypothetical protein
VKLSQDFSVVDLQYELEAQVCFILSNDGSLGTKVEGLWSMITGKT